MKLKAKDILKICAAAMLVAGFVIVFSACLSGRRAVTCNDVRVTVKDSSRFSAVSSEEVKGYLKAYGAYIGRRIDSVDLAKVESILDGKSAIRKSEAYMTRDGALNITITQRVPVVRFIRNGAKDFYADGDGALFSMRAGTPPSVPVIDGALPVSPGADGQGGLDDGQGRRWLSGVIEMVDCMNRSRIWCDNIAQITVQPNGDMIMIAREGRERFIFGSPDKAEDKFRRMKEYYEYIRPLKGEGYYSTVNLKFDGQIVCRK